MIKKKYESIEEYYTREIMPIFEKAADSPHAKNHNRVPGGHTYIPKTKYKPHNARLWVDFKKIHYTPPSLKSYINPDSIRIEGVGAFISYRKINYGKEDFFSFQDFNFTIKKKTIQINAKQISRSEFEIPISEEGLKIAQNIAIEIEKTCINALKSFIGFFGGQSNYTITTDLIAEHKHEDDPILQLGNKNETWHNDIAKKVYKENLVEYHKSIHFQNSISNRAIIDVYPSLATELKNLADSIRFLNDPVQFVISISDNLTELLDNHTEFIKSFNEDQINQLEEKIFQKYSLKV